MEDKDTFEEVSNVRVKGKNVFIEPRTVEPRERKAEKGTTVAVQDGTSVVIQETTKPKVEEVIKKEYKASTPIVTVKEQTNGVTTRTVVIDPEAKK
jgi:hypothetical protein